MAIANDTIPFSATVPGGKRGRACLWRYNVREFTKASYWEGPTYHNGHKPEWHKVFRNPQTLIFVLRWIGREREMYNNRNLMRIVDTETKQESKDLHPGRKFT